MNKLQVIEKLNADFLAAGIEIIVEDLRNFDTDPDNVILDYISGGVKYEIPLHGGEKIKRYIVEVLTRSLRFYNGLDMLQANPKEYWEGLGCIQTPFVRVDSELQANADNLEVENTTTEQVPTPKKAKK